MKKVSSMYRFGILILAVALILIASYITDMSAAFLLFVLVAISGVYILGLKRLWQNAGWGHGLPLWRAVCFLSGMAILALALLGPMDEMADQYFSMHMVQHLLLMKVIAPLLLLGWFSPIFLWAVGKNAAHQTGELWARSRRLRRLWRRFTDPWVAWIAFALCLWFWHIPAFYQAALENEPLHDFEHLLFLGTSLLFWWYLLKTGRDQKLRYGVAVIYLFTTLLHESVLGALLTFSQKSWYSFYSAANPWGLPALHDQQLAGLIMWLPGCTLFSVLIIYYFGAWLRAIEERMQKSHPRLLTTGGGNE